MNTTQKITHPNRSTASYVKLCPEPSFGQRKKRSGRQATFTAYSNGREQMMLEKSDFMLAHTLETMLDFKGYLEDEKKQEKLRELEETGAWGVEKKRDGTRVGVEHDGKVRLPNRRGEDYALHKNLPEFTEFAQLLPKGTILDGEAVSFCNPEVCRRVNPRFNECHEHRIGFPCRLMSQKRCSAKDSSTIASVKQVPIQLDAFDILRFKGENTTTMPYFVRKQLLRDLVEKIEHPNLKYLSYQTKGFAEQFNHELEGVMLKRLKGKYFSGRGYEWIKAKHTARKLCFILGWTKSDSATNKKLFRSLILVDENGNYVGKCGASSFSMQERHRIKEHLDACPKLDVPWQQRTKIKDYFVAVETKLQLIVLYQEISQYLVMYAPRKLQVIYPLNP